MKHFLLLGLFLLTTRSGAFPCPATLDSDAKSALVHQWLDRFKGRFPLGGCQVEITACDASVARGSEATLGEIYLVDAHRAEAYLPLIMVAPGNAQLHTELRANPHMIHYLKFDRFFEPEYGRTEAYRLEIVLNPRTGTMQNIDLGTYATRKKLHQPSGNESRWYHCGP